MNRKFGLAFAIGAALLWSSVASAQAPGLLRDGTNPKMPDFWTNMLAKPIPNNTGKLIWRNAANNGNLNEIYVDTNNNLNIGAASHDTLLNGHGLSFSGSLGPFLIPDPTFHDTLSLVAVSPANTGTIFQVFAPVNGNYGFLAVEGYTGIPVTDPTGEARLVIGTEGYGKTIGDTGYGYQFEVVLGGMGVCEAVSFTDGQHGQAFPTNAAFVLSCNNHLVLPNAQSINGYKHSTFTETSLLSFDASNQIHLGNSADSIITNVDYRLVVADTTHLVGAVTVDAPSTFNSSLSVSSDLTALSNVVATGVYKSAGFSGITSCTVAVAGATVTIKGGLITSFTGC
jgi:hypothetical protein